MSAKGQNVIEASRYLYLYLCINCWSQLIKIEKQSCFVVKHATVKLSRVRPYQRPTGDNIMPLKGIRTAVHFIIFKKNQSEQLEQPTQPHPAKFMIVA